MNFKRYIALISVAVFVLVFAAACGGGAVPDRLVGEWMCDDMASDGQTDTSYYALIIEKNGEFSLYDYQAGNPGIAGKMKGDDTGKIGILELNCDSEDFDPPFCWSMKEKSRIRYKIIDENTIKLGYVGVWLTFRK